LHRIDARRDRDDADSAPNPCRDVARASIGSMRCRELARPWTHLPAARGAGRRLEARGHTEAIVDLCRLAGLNAAGVVCEIMNADGTMARLPELLPFAAAHGLKLLSIADLIRHRMRTERLVTRVASPQLPTERGFWTVTRSTPSSKTARTSRSSWGIRSPTSRSWCAFTPSA